MDDDDLSQSYARLFSSGDGALVFEDLCREAGLRSPCFPPSNMDGIALAIRGAQKDGQRLLAIYILKMIAEGEDALSRAAADKPPEPDTIKP